MAEPITTTILVSVVGGLLVVALQEGGKVAIDKMYTQPKIADELFAAFVAGAKNRPDQIRHKKISLSSGKVVSGFECLISDVLKVGVCIADSEVILIRIDKRNSKWEAGAPERLAPDKLRDELRERYDFVVKQKNPFDKISSTA